MLEISTYVVLASLHLYSWQKMNTFSDESPFTESEKAAGERLRGLKRQYGVMTFPNRNATGDITQLDLRSVQKRDLKAIRSLADLRALQVVIADGPMVCDELLKVLAPLPCLERISVWDAKYVTDEGVQFLSAASRLTQLEMHGAQISDVGLRSIGEIVSLERLTIEGSDSVSNNGLSLLGALQKLHILQLSGPLIDDDGVVHLAALKNLELLSLEATRVRGWSFQQLCGLKKLAYLIASDSLFDNQGLSQLAGFPKLNSMTLMRTPITDEGIVHLAKIPRLTSVNFTEGALTDASIPAFGQCAKLKDLYLERTSVTPDGRAALKALLPKCHICVSAVEEPEAEDASWEDLDYFWKHPPECLARFKLRKKRASDLGQWATQFQLACSCGHRQGEVLGYRLSKLVKDKREKKRLVDDLFVGPLSFRCGKCETVTEIIDTEEDGYHGRIGASAVYHGTGKPEAFACGQCAGTRWQLQAFVEMNEGAFDLWFDEPDISLENYFDVFRLDGVCAQCQSAVVIANFENLG